MLLGLGVGSCSFCQEVGSDSCTSLCQRTCHILNVLNVHTWHIVIIYLILFWSVCVEFKGVKEQKLASSNTSAVYTLFTHLIVSAFSIQFLKCNSYALYFMFTRYWNSVGKCLMPANTCKNSCYTCFKS